VPVEREGESASILPRGFKSKIIKFTKRPFGFSFEAHPVLGYAMVTKVTNPDLKDLSELAILEIGDRIATGINIRELIEIFKGSPLPVDVTFGEYKMPERLSKQTFHFSSNSLKLSQDTESKEFSTEDTSEVLSSSKKKQSPSCFGPKIRLGTSRSNLNPRVTKLIDNDPEKALLIERVSGINLGRAHTLPDQLVGSRKRKKESG